MQMFNTEATSFQQGEPSEQQTPKKNEFFLGQSADLIEEGLLSGTAAKASLFTLVARTKTLEELVTCRAMVRLVSKRCPCKIILIHTDPTSSQQFHKERTSFKNISPGANGITCELIFYFASEDQLTRASFSIIPEIVPDLPLYLLGGSLPSEMETTFSMLIPYTTKIIFETPRIQEYHQFAHELLGCEAIDSYIDLKWLRTKPWRDALFRIFDDKERIEHLKNASMISIRYAKPPALQDTDVHNTEAVYLQAWLAACLGWTLDKREVTGERLHLFYMTKTTPLEIDITPSDSALMSHGAVASVEIHGGGGTHYLIEYEGDDRHIVVHSSTPDRCEMPFVLSVGSFERGQLIMNELFRATTTKSQYAIMLRALKVPGWLPAPT